MGLDVSPEISDHRGVKATVVTGVVVVVGVICVAIGLAFTLNGSRPIEPPVTTAEPTVSTNEVDQIVGPVMASSIPVSLAIPAIEVQTTLLSLGLTKEGVLEVPPHGPNYDRAGWYRYSPTPGALGPSVIVGHVDSATEGRSVFFRLGSLATGSEIRIARTDGTIAIFAVDDVRRYDKSRFPTKLVYGNTDHAALRLITCGGPINPKNGHYRDNVVVSASLVGSTATPTPMLKP